MLDNKSYCGGEGAKFECEACSFRKKVPITRVGGVHVHAFECALLYKEKGNDAKVLVKFLP